MLRIGLAVSLCAASTSAFAYTPIAPADFDMSGLWVLDARPSPAGVREFPVCDPLITPQENYPAYGRSWLELRATDSMYVFEQFDTPKVIVRYEGTLHYFQGYGSFEQVEGTRWRVDYGCAIEPLEYQVVGELTYHYLDEAIYINVMGPVVSPSPYEHAGTAGVVEDHLSAGDFTSAPILFLDYLGTRVSLYLTGANPTNAGQVPDGCDRVLYQGIGGISRTTCDIVYPQSWTWRRSDTPPDVIPKGNISGTVVEGLPDGTDNDERISRAKVRAFRMPKAVRPQGPSETTEDYDRYLAAERQSWELRGEARPDASGRFVLEALPELAPGPDGRGLRRALYALEVTEAVKEDLISGELETLTFLPGRRFGLEVGADERIVLVPAAALAVKRELSVTLRDLAPEQYGPIEEQVQTYLLQLESGSITLTPERLEGVKRAVWAERAVYLGTQLAQPLIETFVEGLADALTEQFKKISSTQSPELKKAKEKLDKLEEQGGEAARAAGFVVSDAQFDAHRAAMGKLLDDNPELADLRKFDLIMKFFNAAFVGLKSAMIRGGITEENAGAIVTLFQDRFFLILQAIISGDRGPIYDQAVKEIVKASSKYVFDSIVPVSYAGLTSGALEQSRADMLAWAVDDPAQYAADRALTINDLDAMISSVGLATQTIQVAQGFSEGVGNAANVYELVPVPAFQSAARMAKAAKKVTDVGVLISSCALAFGSIPLFVDLAANRAFGRQSLRSVSLPNAGALVPIGEPARIELAVAGDALNQALRRHREAIGFDVDDQIDTLAHASNSVLAVLGEYDRALGAYLLQLSGAWLDDPVAEETVVVAQGQYMQFRTELSEALRDERDLLLSVLAGELNAGSPEYQAGAARLIRRYQGLESGLSPLVGTLTPFFAVGDAMLVKPAVSLDPPVLESQTTGLGSVSAVGERFFVRSKVRSVSTSSVGPVTVELTLQGAASQARIVGASTQTFASLAGNDGVAGGADQAEVVFEVEALGPLDSLDDALLVVRVVEDAGFVGDLRGAPLAPSAGLKDVDSDGMPDPYETQRGLDPTIDDSRLDLDGDGLANVDELLASTSVDQSDTDGDGLSDGEERAAGADGFVTDPLEADTDGDGTADAQDGAPDDGTRTTTPDMPAPEPIVAVDRAELVLTTDEPVLMVRVTNAGAGRLYWTAVLGLDTAMVEVAPTAPTVRQEGDYLVVRLPPTVRAALLGGERLLVPIRIVDVYGADPDFREVQVHLNEATAPGVDGGVPGEDASIGPGPDGSVGPGADGGVRVDGGPTDGEPDGGCGCALATRDQEPTSWAGWMLLGLAWLGTRRLRA